MGGRILYLEPLGGIAGDMFMACAVDLGVEPAAIERALSGLGVPGWKLEVTKQARHEIFGTHVDVVVSAAEQPHHRALSDIQALIRGCATMSERAKSDALRTFELIGRAEAKVHRMPLEQVHFHEVGAVDSIVDVCASAVVLELLGHPEVFSAPPPMGSGTARTAHGVVPVPPPATLELLEGVPVRFEGVGELTTPTGAAILKTHATVAPPPLLAPERVGYGVGTKDWKDRANVLRGTLGARVEASSGLHVLEANLDDCSPQLIGLLLERLLAAGALDVWVLPATMKKGRPGHLLGVLVRAESKDGLTALLFAESTTLGVRSHPVERAELERRFEAVATAYGEVRIKVGHRGGELLNANPEFEDCRAAAERAGVPVKVVWAEALAAWTAKRSG